MLNLSLKGLHLRFDLNKTVNCQLYTVNYEASCLMLARLEEGGARMYAIIETGGKQYKVQEGDVVFIEKLVADEGAVVTFDKVLLVSKDDAVDFGSPVVKDATVNGKILGHGKEKKVIIFKYKPKKGYRNKTGHRQPYTKVQIEKINA